LGNNLFPFSCSIHTNLFSIRFTLAIVRGGALIPRTLSLKESFSSNVEDDIPNLLTMIGGFVGIELVPVATKENSTFIKDSKYSGDGSMHFILKGLSSQKPITKKDQDKGEA